MILVFVIEKIVQQNTTLSDISVSTWATVVMAIAAVIALAISIWSICIAKRAQTLAERQDNRRKPSFVVYLMKGFFRTSNDRDGNRVYAFLISISNTSDSNDSIASLDLNITLTSGENSQITFKIPCDYELGDRFRNDARRLAIPIQIAAHETKVGWSYFLVNKNLLANSSVDRYQIVLIDSQGYRVTVEPVLVNQVITQDELNEEETDINPQTA